MSAAQENTQPHIRSFVRGTTGVIELDRPKALNSLDLEMLRGIDDALDKWEHDNAVQQIVITSSKDRAFCAGGDVRRVREEDARGNYAAGDDFFEEEYRLNLRLGKFHKPLVALLEGVVMGGGFGISAHGSHRIVTPRTLGAMPEMAIGFVPDVGMSYTLTHLDVSPVMGLFIGLTGWRLSPADMLYTGLGTHAVEDIHAFLDDLCAVDSPSEDALHAALSKHALSDEDFAKLVDNPQSELQTHREFIEQTFASGSWVDIQNRLADATAAAQKESPSEEDAPDDPQNFRVFLDKVNDAIAVANPESLVAAVELFRRSTKTDLETALDNERAVGNQLRRQENFLEGVRAVLIDKDRNASFDPSDARDVDVEKWRQLLS